MGIQFTGEAIGTSIRQLALRTRSHAMSLTGAVMILLADLLFLYIWWQALRTAPARRNPALLFELLGPVRHHRDGRRAGPLQRQIEQDRRPCGETL